MISIAAMTNSGGAAEYYSKDDYYFAEEGGVDYAEATLTWKGKGAAQLGLSGPVDKSDLSSILGGRNPDPNGPAISKTDVETRRREGSEPAPDEGREAKAPSDPDLERDPPETLDEADKNSAPEKDAAPQHDDADPEADTPDREASKGRFWDLTTSAPKSVSMMALIGGDTRLLEAHRSALDVMMGYAEDHFAVTRLRNEDGTLEHVKTGNLILAQVEHYTSRAGDPQLHTHTLIASQTYHAERDQWYALEPKHLFEAQRLLTQIYQSELAKSALALGYNLERNKNGTFDIADITAEQKEAFSQRASEISEAIARTGATSPEQIESLKLSTREGKLDTPVNELRPTWEAMATELGFDHGAILDRSDGATPGLVKEVGKIGQVNEIWARLSEGLERFVAHFRPEKKDPYAHEPDASPSPEAIEARAALSFATRVHEQRSAVFSEHAILTMGFAKAPLGIGAWPLIEEMRAMVNEKKLIRADAERFDGMTTTHVLQMEKEILAYSRNGKDSVEAPYTPIQARDRLIADNAKAVEMDKHPLNRGQAAAALHLLTTRDLVSGVHGAAGVGKTTMLAVVGAALKDRGIEMVGLTPTHTAKNALASSTDLEASTLAKFLTKYGHYAETGKATLPERAEWSQRRIVVDEASMVTNKNALQLLRIGAALGVPITFVYDTLQHSGTEAGLPVRMMQENGLATAFVNQIVRQDPAKSPNLYNSVVKLSKGDSHGGIRALGEELIQIGRSKSTLDVATAVAETFMTMRGQGIDTLMMAVSQKQRHAANDYVLTRLEEKGEVSKLGGEWEFLLNTYLSTAQKQTARAFELGDVLVFNKPDLGGFFQPGDQAKVIGIDAKRNLLSLENRNGADAILNLDSARRRNTEKFDVFRVDRGHLYKDAKAVWERSDTGRNLLAGEALTIIGEDQGRYRIALADGTTISMAKDDPQLKFIGPGYAVTSYRAQSASEERPVLAMLHNAHATHAAAYVEISRAKIQIIGVTNDAKLLMYNIAQNSGQNLIGWRSLKDLSGVSDTLKINAPYDLSKSEPANALNEAAEIQKEFERDRPLQSAQQIQKEIEIVRSINLPGRGT